MKTIIILFIGLIFSLKIQAQTTVTTTTISVKGNCGECKERIENAADIKGVKVCKWDEKTQVATITFDASKVTVAKIEAAIAKSGHDTPSAKADDKSYKSLPDCCKYKDGDCKK